MKFTSSDKYKENIILKLTFEFALEVVKYSEHLDEKGKHVIAKQIIRSGTSVGANTKEAQNAESKKDFIHKLKIALKEADETEYWLYLCDNLNGYPSSKHLITKLESITKILNKIIHSSKTN